MTGSTSKTLLIIDDDSFFCQTLGSYLSNKNYSIISAHTIEQGTKLYQQHKIDVILLDQKLPDGHGIDLCKRILETGEPVKIIFITAFPNFDSAVKALRLGAFDYLSKPLEIEEVARTVTQAFRTLELETVEQIQNYKDKQEFASNVLIGKENGLKNTYRYIQLAAANQVPVLITGETGTGKNVVAKSIHYYRSSEKGSFMGINCAALPENLIEAELFGFEKGAFTGAGTSKKGIFELADGGTLFLDEIGEIPLHLQSKLLGVLDDHHIKRIGGQSFKRITVRVIAATNVDLESAVLQKKFRQDLFYRLSVLPIHIPPLRERTEDIPMLCNYFVQNSVLHHDISLPADEIEKLKKYYWPGNVRELKNIIERALIFQRSKKIFPSELLTGKPSEMTSEQLSLEDTIPTLQELERCHIKDVLSRLENNHTQTAKALGISRSTLLRKLKSFNGPSSVSQ